MSMLTQNLVQLAYVRLLLLWEKVVLAVCGDLIDFKR